MCYDDRLILIVFLRAPGAPIAQVYSINDVRKLLDIAITGTPLVCLEKRHVKRNFMCKRTARQRVGSFSFLLKA